MYTLLVAPGKKCKNYVPKEKFMCWRRLWHVLTHPHDVENESRRKREHSDNVRIGDDVSSCFSVWKAAAH